MNNDVLKKMDTELSEVVQYSLNLNGILHDMNSYIGNNLKITWKGLVICQCGKEMKKFYRSGFCYSCYWESPKASQSIFKPELCTAHLDIEERDLAWEKEFSEQMKNKPKSKSVLTKVRYNILNNLRLPIK